MNEYIDPISLNIGQAAPAYTPVVMPAPAPPISPELRELTRRVDELLSAINIDDLSKTYAELVPAILVTIALQDVKAELAKLVAVWVAFTGTVTQHTQQSAPPPVGEQE